MMLNHTVLRDPDENEAVDPSTTAEAPVETTGGDVKGDSSSAESDLTKGLADAIKKGVDAAVAKQGGTEEPTDEAVEALEKDGESSETKEEAVEASTEEKKDDGEKTGPVPYDRFREINESKKSLEAWRAEAEPLVAIQQGIASYCESNEITPEDFKYWLEVAALSKKNPEEALKRLSPQLETMKGFTGDALSPELQKAVESGDINLEYAKKLQAAETRQRHIAEQSQRQQARANESAAQAEVRATLTSFNNWFDTIKKTNPDLTPSKNGEGPYELFSELLNSQVKTQREAGKPVGPHEVVAIGEAVLKRVRGLFPKASPKPAQPTLRTNKSTGVTLNGKTPNFKDMGEAIRYGAAQAARR